MTTQVDIKAGIIVFWLLTLLFIDTSYMIKGQMHKTIINLSQWVQTYKDIFCEKKNLKGEMELSRSRVLYAIEIKLE